MKFPVVVPSIPIPLPSLVEELPSTIISEAIPFKDSFKYKTSPKSPKRDAQNKTATNYIENKHSTKLKSVQKSAKSLVKNTNTGTSVRLHAALQHKRVRDLFQTRMNQKFAISPAILEFKDCSFGLPVSKVLVISNNSSDQMDDLEFEIVLPDKENSLFQFSQIRGYISAGRSVTVLVTYLAKSNGFHHVDVSISAKFIVPFAKSIFLEPSNVDSEFESFKSNYIDTQDELLFKIYSSIYLCGFTRENTIKKSVETDNLINEYVNKNKEHKNYVHVSAKGSNITFSTSFLEFMPVRINSKKVLSFKVFNVGFSAEKIFFKLNAPFFAESSIISQPNSSSLVSVSFCPRSEGKFDQNLVFSTEKDQLGQIRLAGYCI